MQAATLLTARDEALADLDDDLMGQVESLMACTSQTLIETAWEREGDALVLALADRLQSALEELHRMECEQRTAKGLTRPAPARVVDMRTRRPMS